MLNFKENTCIYYESRESMTEKGQIVQAEVTDVRLANDRNEDSSFEVVTPRRVFLLKTANATKLNEWMDNFRRFAGRPRQAT